MKKVIFSALSLFALFCASCSKSANDVSSTLYTDINSFFNSMVPTPKIIIIDAGTGASFYGNSGTRYIFPANSFRTASGTTVTGAVTIQATEYLKRSDMATSGVLPLSNGRVLISGGEINVKATQGGQQVFMANGKMYQAIMPQNGTPVAGMGLFFSNGVFNAQDTGRVNNWQPAPDTPAAHGNGEIIYHGDSISIVTDTMGYCNADQFMATYPTYQTFTVTLDAGGKAITNAVKAFALYDTYNSMWPLGMIGSIDKGVITEMHVPSMPVHFVAATIIDGSIYAGVLGATPVTGANYTVSIHKMTQAEFKTLIDSY